MAEDLNKLWSYAVEQMAKRRFDKAVEAFVKLCAAEPANPTYRRRLGDAQRQGGQLREATLTYQALAERYARDGWLVKAIAINKLILEMDPGHTATQTTLAGQYAGQAGAAAVAAPPPAVPATPEPPQPGRKAVRFYSVGGAEELPRPPPTPLFSDLDPRSFVELLQRCTTRRFQPSERIIRQGDPGESFFVISSGSVKVSRMATDGARIALAHLREGAFFGEMAQLGGGPRTASVVAAEETELLEFPRPVLAQLMSEHPSVKEAVDNFLRSRLLTNVVAASPLFRSLDADGRRRLISRFQLVEVAADQHVVKEGTPGDSLYVVMNGRFVALSRAQGVLAEFRESDVFGEISMLTGSNVTADVVAAGAGRVLRLSRQDFEELGRSHPEIRDLAFKLASSRTGTEDAVLGGTVDVDVPGEIEVEITIDDVLV